MYHNSTTSLALSFSHGEENLSARSTFTPVVGTSAPTQLRTSAPAPSGVPPTPRETPRQDGFVFSMPSTKQGLSTKTPSKSSKPGQWGV
ncbi:hypothetical protein BDV93DRAFT_528865 [Ceratobasidium sp. AG-I]|nr:hypothetical protein BDV93DRAFT_528865 [Ceratobasidium sp. AG-I]